MKSILTVALMFLLAVPVFPVEEKERQKVGRAVLTFYWIVDETSSRYDGKHETELGNLTAEVSCPAPESLAQA